MASEPARLRFLKDEVGPVRFVRYAWFTVAFCVAVILWGAYVRASGSGAGCGEHWPLCNGEIVPRTPSFQTLVEFAHRLTSGLSLLLVAGLMFQAFRAYDKGTLVRRAAVASFVFIILEAVIGAGLVQLQLVEHDRSTQRIVSIVLHLANTSLLMGALTVTATAAASGARAMLPRDPALRKPLIAFMGAFLLLAGAGAVTALGDTLFRPASLAEGWQSHADPGSHPLQKLRIYHPALAILWGGLLAPWIVGWRSRFAWAATPAMRRATSLVAILVLGNLALGFANILLLAPVAIQLTHLLLANLIWISLVSAATQAAALEGEKFD